MTKGQEIMSGSHLTEADFEAAIRMMQGNSKNKEQEWNELKAAQEEYGYSTDWKLIDMSWEQYKEGDTFKFSDYGGSVTYLDDKLDLQNHKNEIATVTISDTNWIDAEWPDGSDFSLFTNVAQHNEVKENTYKVTKTGEEEKEKMPRRKKIPLEAGDYFIVSSLPQWGICQALRVDQSGRQVSLKTQSDDPTSLGEGFDYSEIVVTDSIGVPIKKTRKSSPKQLPAATTPTDATPIADQFVMMIGMVDQQISQRIEEKVGTELDILAAEVKKAKEDLDKTRKVEIVIGEKSKVLPGMQHKNFSKLLTVAELRLNALLVGMAGTGKTHAGEQVADALDLPFYTMSVGAQTSKSDIIGYMNANGGYVKTHFRDAYEHGGVFLMDEIDAGNANVLIQVNAALSNGVLAFPDAMVNRHEDFVFIASANTYGTGMNRQYVGRNQLDAATLDRFTIINWEIDDDLEEALCQDELHWLNAVRAGRQYVADHNIRALITPRATQKGALLLKSGFDVGQVIESVLLGTLPEDKHADFVAQVERVYKGF